MTKRPYVDNAGDPEQVREGKQKSKRARELELNDLRFVLSSAQGRRFIWRVMAQCGTYQSIVERDPHHTYYKAGQQDLGHFLVLETIEANEEMYLRMQAEARRTEREEDAQPKKPAAEPEQLDS